jgi:hypothetical protein
LEGQKNAEDVQLTASKTGSRGLLIKDEKIFSLSYQLEELKESRNVMCERAEAMSFRLLPIDDVISRMDFVSEMIRLKDYSMRLVCR